MSDQVKDVKVTNMIIKIGKKELNLTIEEAKKLKDALDEIFVTKQLVKETHIHHHDYYWSYPHYTYTYPYVYCGTGNAGTLTNMATSNNNWKVSYSASTNAISCSIPMLETDVKEN